MAFIDPRVDFAFKKIFGSHTSTEILVSFLNATIYGGKRVIQDVTIRNPYLPSELSSLKETYLDIQAVLGDGSFVIVEMQIANANAFLKRVFYNAAKHTARNFRREFTTIPSRRSLP